MRELKPLDGPFGGRMNWDMNEGRWFDSEAVGGPYYYPWGGGLPFEHWRKQIMIRIEAEKKLQQKYQEEIEEYGVG